MFISIKVNNHNNRFKGKPMSHDHISHTINYPVFAADHFISALCDENSTTNTPLAAIPNGPTCCWICSTKVTTNMPAAICNNGYGVGFLPEVITTLDIHDGRAVALLLGGINVQKNNLGLWRSEMMIVHLNTSTYPILKLFEITMVANRQYA